MLGGNQLAPHVRLPLLIGGLAIALGGDAEARIPAPAVPGSGGVPAPGTGGSPTPGAGGSPTPGAGGSPTPGSSSPGHSGGHGFLSAPLGSAAATARVGSRVCLEPAIGAAGDAGTRVASGSSGSTGSTPADRECPASLAPASVTSQMPLSTPADAVAFCLGALVALAGTALAVRMRMS